MIQKLKEGDSSVCFIVFAHLRPKVLEQCHDSVTGGHFFMEKTIGKVLQKFYWLGVRKDVDNWMQSSESCLTRRPQTRPYRKPLHPIEPVSPWHSCVLDILEPLPPSSKGNKYIILWWWTNSPNGQSVQSCVRSLPPQLPRLLLTLWWQSTRVLARQNGLGYPTGRRISCWTSCRTETAPVVEPAAAQVTAPAVALVEGSAVLTTPGTAELTDIDVSKVETGVIAAFAHRATSWSPGPQPDMVPEDSSAWEEPGHTYNLRQLPGLNYMYY